MGKGRKEEARARASFLEHDTEVTYHFLLRLISQDFVLWPHLAARESEKCSLFLPPGWAYAKLR